jgi:hypothetical protein
MKRLIWLLPMITILLTTCRPVASIPATFTSVGVPREIATATLPTPRFHPVCGPPQGDEFAGEDAFGDGYISHIPIPDVRNSDSREIVRVLVHQWLEHYKTASQSPTAAIKAYSIDTITIGDPFCNPFFQIYASVGFSIIPFEIPTDFAPFPAPTPINPNDPWWHLFAPFGVFRDGDNYRLRLVSGWGT